MKSSPAVTPRTSLRFLAVSVMFCAILVHIFALEEKLARKLREEDGVSEGTEVGEKQSIPRKSLLSYPGYQRFFSRVAGIFGVGRRPTHLWP